MKILLDTHILLWYFDESENLSLKARNIIENDRNEIYFSSLSIFEIDLKHTNHPEQMPYTGEEIFYCCLQAGFKPLSIVDNMIFMTHDERIAEYVTDSIYKV